MTTELFGTNSILLTNQLYSIDGSHGQFVDALVKTGSGLVASLMDIRVPPGFHQHDTLCKYVLYLLIRIVFMLKNKILTYLLTKMVLFV